MPVRPSFLARALGPELAPAADERAFGLPSPVVASLQAYHSTFNELDDVRQVGNTSVLPIKSRFRGPGPLGVFLSSLA